MKKIFTLIAMVMLTVASHAQVVFVDLQGKEYGDGETMTILPEVDEEYGDVIFESPSIKNNGSQAVNLSLEVNITKLPERTMVQECFGSQCTMHDKTGSHTVAHPDAVKPGETASLMTEWQCYDYEADDYAKSTCTIEFTIYIDGAKGPKVTVNYCNETAGIKGIEQMSKAVSAYSVDGIRMNNAQKGITVVKANDGSVRKVMK